MKIQLSDQAIAMLNQQGEAWAAAQQVTESAWVTQKTTVVYCNPRHPGGVWSVKGEGDRYLDAPADSLKGVITKLWYTRRDDDSITWYLQISGGGENFIIQSAHDRGFSRSMLSGLVQLSAEQLRGQVTVQCSPHDAEKGMMQFCNLHVGGQAIEAPRVGPKELAAVAIAAMSLVAEANGYEYKPGKN